MPAEGSPPAELRFPGWELRLLTRELRIEGQPVRLGDRAFDLLQTLALRAGQVVGKSELMDRVWPGRVVEENNLSVQIATLRRVLGGDVVQNVSGVGYRLAALPIATARPAASHPAADHAMPPPEVSLLVGRDADLARLRSWVGQGPLVSLVGSGGVGKTTLARCLFAMLPPRADGLHWIDLSPLRPGAALLPLLARALGLLSPVGAAPDDTVRALAGCDALLVLDNCEHLVDEVAALLEPLLHTAPRLHWLATTQEALRLPGEQVYRLGPLAVPEADAAPSQPSDSAALALFCRRVDATGAGVAWTAGSLAIAAELCRRLDGLPLALEIAAARVATLGLDGVLGQLDQRLRMRSGLRSAPSRQHSLLQTYEWSDSLLSPQEQRVFRSLQPFAGGFTAELVRRLHARAEPDAADAGWAALDALQALVDKSLVQAASASTGAAPRLWLLESARDFARLQLAASGELESARRAHADVMADWMDRARVEYDSLRDVEWGQRHAPEHRNVQAALAWACGVDDPDLLARLIAALGCIEAFTQTSSDLVRMELPLARVRAATPAHRAAALLELGWAHHLDGSRGEATALASEALADFEALGDSAGAYLTLSRMIRMHHGRPGQQAHSRAAWQRLQRIDASSVPLRARLSFESSSSYLVAAPRSLQRLHELRALAERAGFDDIVAVCDVNITDELMVQGRDDEVVATARRLLDGGMALPRRRAQVCHNLALSLVRMGRVDEAREPVRVLLRALPAQAYMVLDLFAFAAAQAGRMDDATLIAACAAGIRRRRDLDSEVCEAALIDQTWQRLRQGLDAARLAELTGAGEALPVDQALQLALRS